VILSSAISMYYLLNSINQFLKCTFILLFKLLQKEDEMQIIEINQFEIK